MVIHYKYITGFLPNLSFSLEEQTKVVLTILKKKTKTYNKLDLISADPFWPVKNLPVIFWPVFLCKLDWTSRVLKFNRPLSF